jgi:hypothetical protein
MDQQVGSLGGGCASALSEREGVRVRKVIEARLLAPVGMFWADASESEAKSVRVESVCGLAQKEYQYPQGVGLERGRVLGHQLTRLAMAEAFPLRGAGVRSAAVFRHGVAVFRSALGFEPRLGELGQQAPTNSCAPAACERAVVMQ